MKGFSSFIISVLLLTITACSSGSDKPKSFAEAYDISDYDFVVISKADIGLGTENSLWKMVWNEERTVNGNQTNYKLIGFLVGPWGEIPLQGNYFFPSINTRRAFQASIATTDLDPIGPDQVTNIHISIPYRTTNPDLNAWVTLIDVNGAESHTANQIKVSYDKFP